MRPTLTFGLTLAGVLLASIPLLYLTAEAPKREIHENVDQELPSTNKLLARVQFTGTPLACTLRFEGQELATMPTGTFAPWEVELSLPQQNTIELEAELQWTAESAENAVSITLEPAQKDARTDTRWTGPDGTLLHDIFIFTW